MTFSGEVKRSFHQFLRAVIEANKANFLEGESPTLRWLYFDDEPRVQERLLFHIFSQKLLAVLLHT